MLALPLVHHAAPCTDPDQAHACAEAQRRFCETEGYEGQSSNVLRTMGYFSLVGLLR